MSKTFKNHNVIATYKGFDIYKRDGHYTWDGGGNFVHISELRAEIDSSVGVKPNRRERLNRDRMKRSMGRYDDLEYTGVSG